MARECQEKNAKGLTMVAVGMNKAADELMILDERTREELASGKYRDQRRGSFGTSGAAPASPAAASAQRPARGTSGAAPPSPAPTSPARPARRPVPPARPRWTAKQERLALLYNAQGLKPGEIAAKLGVSTYLATQIILAAKTHR
jgi:hypothetical protein